MCVCCRESAPVSVNFGPGRSVKEILQDNEEAVRLAVIDRTLVYWVRDVYGRLCPILKGDEPG